MTNTLFSILTPTRIRLLIIAGVTGLLGFGYYLQLVDGLEPCPLCITQRFFMLLAGLLALAALIHRPQRIGIAVYSGTGLLLALIGGGFSSRQLYLQSLPADQVPACGPSLSYMLDTFPLMEALQVMLRGNGNCAEVVWTWLGLSIPGWSLIAFSGLAIGWCLHFFSGRYQSVK